MTPNMGTVDRIIRTVVALVVAWLYFTERVAGVLGIVLLIVAVVLLVTSVVGFCPAYLPLKLSTRKGAAPPPAGGTAG